MIPSSLDAIARRLREEYSLTPVLATEIEFYLAAPPTDALWEAVRHEIAIEKYEREKGPQQWEVALSMQRTPGMAAQQLARCKEILAAFGADFSAKPFADAPGSGLHVHLHLEDAQGANVFYKKDAIISDALKWSIGGLLATMREYMPVFAPTEASRARFVPGGNAPTTLSWGANNRTVAIRLPDVGAPFRHIEHRVAGADAQPEAVIAAVLTGVHYGLTHRSDPGPQIYGDAALATYGLPPIL